MRWIKSMVKVYLVFIIISVITLGHFTVEAVETTVDKDSIEEVIDMRTTFSKTFINEKGIFTQEVYNTPIHFETEEGNLHTISTDLVSMNDIDLENYDISLGNVRVDETNNKKQSLNTNEKRKAVSKENVNKYKKLKEENKKNNQQKKIEDTELTLTTLEIPYEVTINKDIRKGYSVSKDDVSLHFIPLNAKKTLGKIENTNKNKIVYTNPWPSTTLELTVLPSGVKEDIILHDNKAPKSFTFEVQGDIDESLENNEFYIEPAWLVDGNGTLRDVKTTLFTEKNKKYIRLDWDNSDLVFPITIDPTVTTTDSRVFVSCSSPTIDLGSFKVGYSQTISQNCSNYLQFLISIPDNARIVNSQFSIYGKLFSYNNLYNPMNAIIKQVTSSIHRGAPSPSTIDAGKSSILISEFGGKGNWITWDITEITKNSFKTGMVSLKISAESINNNPDTGSLERTYTTSYPIKLVINYDNTQYENFYEYDSLNRLINHSINNSSTYTYSHDKNGNLISGSRTYPIKKNILLNGSFNLSNSYWNVGNKFSINNVLIFNSQTSGTNVTATTAFPQKVKTNKSYTFSGKTLNNLTTGKMTIKFEQYNSEYGVVTNNFSEITINSSDLNKGIWKIFTQDLTVSGVTQWVVVKIEAEPGTEGQVNFTNFKLIEN